MFALEDGNNYDQIIAALKTMEDWDPADRRPMIVIGKTLKGYWPGAVDGKIPGYGDQLVSYPSHPYAMRMNSEYFVALAETFEKHYDVEFQGIRQGPVTDPRERLMQFKTNIDVVMSLLDRNGLGDWLADRLVAIADTVQDDLPLRIDPRHDPFLDDRLRVANLPVEPQTCDGKNAVSGAEKQVDIALFRKPGEVAGTRRAISEIIKWMNYVTDNRFITLAADLSDSINVEHGSLWGHYDPDTNPLGTRFKAAIQEAGNASSAIGLVGQSAALDPEQVRRGVGLEWHLWRLYATHVPASAGLESAESGQPLSHGSVAYSGRAFGAGNGGGCAHALWDFCAAGVETLPAWADDSSQFLGLQRCRPRLFCGGGNCRQRSEGRGHYPGSGPA